jgi:hypothetical protein
MLFFGIAVRTCQTCRRLATSPARRLSRIWPIWRLKRIVAFIEYLAIVRSVLVHAMNTEAAKGNAYATERVAGRLLETLRDLGRITGEVTDFARTSISIANNSAVVMNSPIVAEMQTELLVALQPFPDARAAVISAVLCGLTKGMARAAAASSLRGMLMASSPSIYAKFADALRNDWRGKARPEQLAPAGDWTIWILLAGRAFGKTRSAAEHIREIADAGAVRHIGLVGQTAASIRDVMVHGPSGIMSIVPDYNRPVYEPSKAAITWGNGVKLHLFSAEEPERFRGPNLGYLWMDELCSFANLTEVWDMAQLANRAGSNPRTIITTTPKPSKLLKALIAREGSDVVITRGSTYDNRANLAPSFQVCCVQVRGHAQGPAGTRSGGLG